MKDDDLVVLPGEDPAKIRSEDAKQWISVYRELLSGDRGLLRQMLREGDAEMETAPLERHILRLEARLAFWTERLP